MKKYIHYCWFGEKPLPKLAKKCLKSWKKYFPDYEIIKWSEENVDLNECDFIKDAYKKKKYAFVADYVRVKALYEYGGIYFDTDMEVIKPMDEYLKSTTFLGVEDSGFIAAGIWYEKNSNGYLSQKLLEYYKSLKSLPLELYDISIPKLLTNYMKALGFKSGENNIQKLKKDIIIYPRDYFYPLSYKRDNNLFTKNTCAVHYYDASWVPEWEKNEIRLIRFFGEKNAKRILKLLRFVNRIRKRILRPYARYKEKKNILKKNEINYNKTINQLTNLNNKYVAFYNFNWYGVGNATKDLFESSVGLPESITKDKVKEICKILKSKNVELVIFSGFCYNWSLIVNELNQDDSVKIKVLWHGSNAMHLEKYDFDMFNYIFDLLKRNIIFSIGFVKKSMYEMYKKLGYNVEFVMNNVNIDKSKYLCEKKENNKSLQIGLYASGNRWVKNFYNQLSAISLIEDATVDVVPLSDTCIQFGKLLKINIIGSNNVSREELLTRMGKNDINLYVTFVECAPLIPLESLELGVPCLTSGNHHYWENEELEKYLVINKNDNPVEIAKSINYVFENKDEILRLYNIWKKKYNKECIINNKKFIEVGDSSNGKIRSKR